MHCKNFKYLIYSSPPGPACVPVGGSVLNCTLDILKQDRNVTRSVMNICFCSKYIDTTSFSERRKEQKEVL